MQVRGVYWKNFRQERAAGDWPTQHWYFNDRVKLSVSNGDWICFFASGDSIDSDEPAAAHLVQLMKVHSIGSNTGENPNYPPAAFGYVATADRAHNRRVEPLWFDGIIRPRASDPNIHIGIVRQSPWLMDECQQGYVTDLVEGFRFD